MSLAVYEIELYTLKKKILRLKATSCLKFCLQVVYLILFGGLKLRAMGKFWANLHVSSILRPSYWHGQSPVIIQSTTHNDHRGGDHLSF